MDGFRVDVFGAAIALFGRQSGGSALGLRVKVATTIKEHAADPMDRGNTS
jgi:hypothetical protein